MIWLRYPAMAVAAIVVTGAVASAQEVPAEYKAVLSTLGKTADFKWREAFARLSTCWGRRRRLDSKA